MEGFKGEPVARCRRPVSGMKKLSFKRSGSLDFSNGLQNANALNNAEPAPSDLNASWCRIKLK